jgi:hypothetical protein
MPVADTMSGDSGGYFSNTILLLSIPGLQKVVSRRERQGIALAGFKRTAYKTKFIHFCEGGTYREGSSLYQSWRSRFH